MTNPPPVEARLARIEKALAILSAEVAAIRAELDLPRGEPSANTQETTAQASISPSRMPRAAHRLARISGSISAHDLERLVGSYGMLGISVLAAVAAVGTFLSWAISHGYVVLGPAARVLIGLAFAAAIGVWGTRLRRTERSFGSSLLGLALVIVHVCAYAAGPTFGLVPIWIAFAGAAVASCALAVFAHRENDEPLWCVGFGGAAVAPFVTSNGHGSVYALLVYGTLVLLSACFAINRRSWPIAWRVFYLASALFSLASAWQARTETILHFLAAFAFPFVIMVAGVEPFAGPTRKRGAIRWLATLAIFTAFARESYRSSENTWLIAGVMLSASLVCLVFADRQSDVEQSSILERARANPSLLHWVDVAAIPLLFVSEAASAIPAAAQSAAVLLIGSAMFTLFSWRRGAGAPRDAAAFAATSVAMSSVRLLPLEIPTGRIAAFCVVGIAAFGMHVLRPSRGWLSTGALSLFVAVAMSVTGLVERPGFYTAPFVGEPSLGPLIVVIALVVAARLTRPLRAATLAPWLWAFIWVLIELAMAFSASTAALLLVTYFATTAVGCVALGRARDSSRLRQLGLSLALTSAATAVYGAHAYFDFGARIVAYLVTSAFLLGIAYWYRRPGPSPHPA